MCGFWNDAFFPLFDVLLVLSVKIWKETTTPLLQGTYDFGVNAVRLNRIAKDQHAIHMCTSKQKHDVGGLDGQRRLGYSHDRHLAGMSQAFFDLKSSKPKSVPKKHEL